MTGRRKGGQLRPPLTRPSALAVHNLERDRGESDVLVDSVPKCVAQGHFLISGQAVSKLHTRISMSA